MLLCARLLPWTKTCNVRRLSTRQLTLTTVLTRYAHCSAVTATRITLSRRLSLLTRERSLTTQAGDAHLVGTSKRSPPVSPAAGDVIDFLLADIGEGIAECEIIRWFVAVGDRIAQFDKVCEVQSDKANVEITSRYDGVVIEICVQAGQLAKVGAPLMRIRVGGSDTVSTAAGEPSHSSILSARPSPDGHGQIDISSRADDEEQIQDETELSNIEISARNALVQASPAVRRIAKENHVDLSLISGTGPSGRIVKDDVQQFINNKSAQRNTPTTRVPSPQQARPSLPVLDDSKRLQSASPALSSPSTIATKIPVKENRVVPVSGLARIMVHSMTAANQVPHFTYADEISMDALTTLRAQLKHSFATTKTELKLTYLPFIIKALSLALQEFPQLNAHTNADCSAVTHMAAHNVGIAMDTPRGLLVPVVKGVDEMSITDIALSLSHLQSLGAADKLGREQLTVGTITLSNIGAIGGTYMQPLLVTPQVVIIAIGAIRTIPVWDEKHSQARAGKIMNISMSADHRVVDGATLARFAKKLKTYLEQPNTIMIKLK